MQHPGFKPVLVISDSCNNCVGHKSGHQLTSLLSLLLAAVGGATSGAVQGVLTIPAGVLNNTYPVPVELPSPIEQVMLLLTSSE